MLGFTLDIVTLEQAAQWAIAAAGEARKASPVHRPGARTRTAVSFNPELIVTAQGDPLAAAALLEADLCYPDGVGALWAAGRQGARLPVREGGAASSPPQRVAGVDLASRVVEMAAAQGMSVFFLGAAPGVAAEAARRQVERCPGLKVAGTHHGYFSNSEELDVVRAVRESDADILLVAIGAPKQEILLHRYRDQWGAGVGLGIGGSFDVWAGTVKRAPAWTQKAKIEWLYRLASDPRRARRQLALPRYAGQVVRWSPDDYGPPRRGRARAHDEGGDA